MSVVRELSVTERLFALQGTPPLDRLRDSELPHVASVARARSYAPGEPLVAHGRPLRHLIVTIEGTLELGADLAPRVFGEIQLLFGSDMPDTLRAGPEGATVLLLTRPHFFTLINECPALLLGFLQHDSAAAPEQAAP